MAALISLPTCSLVNGGAWLDSCWRDDEDRERISWLRLCAALDSLCSLCEEWLNIEDSKLLMAAELLLDDSW